MRFGHNLFQYTNQPIHHSIERERALPLVCGAVLCSFVVVARVLRSSPSHLTSLFAPRVCEPPLGPSLKRCDTMFLIVMLESSSRLVPSNEAMLMVYSIARMVWRSTIIEASCSSLTTPTIESKCFHVMMMVMVTRSCPSSARKAANQANSTIQRVSRSITIMIASSSAIPAMIEYNHGL